MSKNDENIYKIESMVFKERKEMLESCCFTLKDIFCMWLDKMEIQVKKSTFSNYHNIVHHHIIPCLGDISAECITPKNLDDFVAEKLLKGRIDKSGGLSPKTVQDIIFIVKSAFKFAERNYNIKNPSTYISCPKCIKNEIRILTKDEWLKLEAYLNNDMDFSKLGVLICMYTGIRLGEICALKWENINFEDGVIKIRKTIQRIKNVGDDSIGKTRIIIDAPKSRSSVRDIPLPTFLIKILKEMYEKTTYDSFFLSGRKEKYVEPRTYQNRFKKFLKQAQIREINFHSLRHTFATKCVENEFDIKSLSEILGHSSVEITLNKYVHSSIELKRVYMEKLKIS